MEHPPPAPPKAEAIPGAPAVARDNARDALLIRIAYVIGGIGLLGATFSDALAVAGRHTGLHLLGSIELVQACVVLLGASSMLIATIKRNHASVHIVTDRLRPAARDRMARISALASALLFLLLAIGSAWILADLWNGREETELLHIPLRWLRLLWVLFTVLIMARFLAQSFGRSAEGHP